MRRVLVVFALLATSTLVTPAWITPGWITPAWITPAWALQGSDTMSAWKSASEADRTELLKRLPETAGKPALRRCMDETSSVPGHADLAIAEVAKVCASSEGAGQPV